jgi:hypothetical protein
VIFLSTILISPPARPASFPFHACPSFSFLHSTFPPSLPSLLTLAELLDVSESTASAFSLVAAPIILAVLVLVMVRLAIVVVARGREGRRKAWVVAAARRMTRRRKIVEGVLLLEVDMPLATGRCEALCDEEICCVGAMMMIKLGVGGLCGFEAR